MSRELQWPFPHDIHGYWSKQRDAYPQHILWACCPDQHTFGDDSLTVTCFLWMLLQMTTNMATSNSTNVLPSQFRTLEVRHCFQGAKIKMATGLPWLRCSVVGASSCIPKGCGFDPWKATDECFSLSFSFSPSLSLTFIRKHVLGWGFLKKMSTGQHSFFFGDFQEKSVSLSFSAFWGLLHSFVHLHPQQRRRSPHAASLWPCFCHHIFPSLTLLISSFTS